MVFTTYYNENVCYDLYTINNDSLNFMQLYGYAVAKNINGSWYKFDNVFVTKRDALNAITKPNSCILFYKRKYI